MTGFPATYRFVGTPGPATATLVLTIGDTLLSAAALRAERHVPKTKVATDQRVPNGAVRIV